MNELESKIYADEANPRLKALVIGINILTAIASTIFYVLFFKRVDSSFSGNHTRGKQVLTAAEKLEIDGFKK